MSQCPTCRGTGIVRPGVPVRNGDRRCYPCNGTGFTEDDPRATIVQVVREIGAIKSAPEWLEYLRERLSDRPTDEIDRCFKSLVRRRVIDRHYDGSLGYVHPF